MLPGRAFVPRWLCFSIAFFCLILAPASQAQEGDANSPPAEQIIKIPQEKPDLPAESKAQNVAMGSTRAGAECFRPMADRPPIADPAPRFWAEADCQPSGEDAAPGPPDAHPSDKQDTGDGQPMSVKKVFINLPRDQVAIWTSPFHLKRRDATWLLPLATTAGILIGSDHHSMSRAQSKAADIRRSKTFSNAGLGGMVAVPAFMYLWGSHQNKPRMRETGLLSGEEIGRAHV